MTTLRDAARQALEAWDGGYTEWFKRAYTVMENLRAALAQQAEPVAVADRLARHGIQACLYPDCVGGQNGTICHEHCSGAPK